MPDINPPSSILSEPRASQTEISLSTISNGLSPPKTDISNNEIHPRYILF
jgi:hypothetical protein